MHDLQIVAILALISISIPTALALMWWRERNEAWRQFHMLEHNYKIMVERRNYYMDETNRLLYALDALALPDDTRQWDYS